MSHRLDDAAVVSALLQQWGAPAFVLTRLQATTFTTLGLLGHALPSPDAEDSFLCTILELDPADSAMLHSAPRRLLTHAQDLCPSQYTAAPASSSLSPAPSAQSHKLMPSEVQAMRQKFLASYPGELLTRNLCPRRSSCPHCSVRSLLERPRGCPGDRGALRQTRSRGTMLAVRVPTGSCFGFSLRPRKNPRAPQPSCLIRVR